MEPEAKRAEPSTDAPETEPGRLERLTGEVKGLVEDIRTWIDLKIKLFQIEVEEHVRDVLNRVAVTISIGVLAFLTLVFLLVTVALALGAWWGNTLLGFVAVTLALLVLTLLVYVLRPALARRRSGQVSKASPEVGPAEDVPRLEAAKTEEAHG